jgi:ATP-dependent DNA helicase PIF1
MFSRCSKIVVASLLISYLWNTMRHLKLERKMMAKVTCGLQAMHRWRGSEVAGGDGEICLPHDICLPHTRTIMILIH